MICRSRRFSYHRHTHVAAADKSSQDAGHQHCIKRNRIGPMTELCGTPYKTADGVEMEADRTHCIHRCAPHASCH